MHISVNSTAHYDPVQHEVVYRNYSRLSEGPAVEMTQIEFAQGFFSRLSISDMLHVKRSLTTEMAARIARLHDTTQEIGCICSRTGRRANAKEAGKHQADQDDCWPHKVILPFKRIMGNRRQG